MKIGLIALADDNRSRIAQSFDDDFVVHEAAGLPYSGEYHGATGFRALLEEMTRALELLPGDAMQEWTRDDTVVVRFSLTFLARTSARSVSMPLIELYRTQGGRIVELDVYYKDPAAVAALLADGPA